MISYAQNFEDVMLWRALKTIKNGFYIDVGANHPIDNSVTKYFYDNGWNGINIEPELEQFTLLKKDRQKDINLNIAIHSTKKKINLFVSEINDKGLTTSLENIVEESSFKDSFTKSHLVKAQTLNEICKENNVTVVHFLKIDVEGAEKDVLESFAFEQIRPWIVIVEATKPTTQIDTSKEWEYILLDKDYIFVYFDGLNKFYVAKEKNQLKKYFQYPPNVFDSFVLHPYKKLESELEQSHQKSQELETKTNELQSELEQLKINYNDVIHSNSWKLTKPLRIVGIAIRWFVCGLYHWITFSPSSRPRRVIKNILIKFKHKINTQPKIKSRVIALLKILPDDITNKLIYLNSRDIKEENFKSFFIGNDILHFSLLPLEDTRGIGRVTREQLQYLETNLVECTKAMKDANEIYFFSSIHWCPDQLPENTIIMIHDVIPIVLKKYFPEESKIWSTKFKNIAQQAKHIVTISETSKNDIIKFLEIAPNSISVVNNGVTKMNITKKSNISLPKKFFVYLGSYDKHKNLDVILNALSLDESKEMELVMIGSNKESKVMVNKLGINNRVHYLGRLDDDEAGFVISKSQAILFPSLYEGFGLPPMEAALLYVPSICSTKPTMTEFLKDIALFADPNKPEEWLQAMQKLTNNEDLRTELGNKSYHKIKNMTWEKSGNNLVKVLSFQANTNP